MMAALALALHAALILLAAPLVAGLTRRWTAQLAGRSGPPLVQPWRDLVRLLRKQPVLPDHTSWVFATAPAVSLAAVLAAALLVPSFALSTAAAAWADLLVLAGLLALSRGVLVLALYDSGTAAAGLAAGRAGMMQGAIAPAWLLAVLALAMLGGTTNLPVLCAAVRDAGPGLRWCLVPALAALGVVALAETGTAPFGQPLSQAVAQEYSGRHLAMLDYAAQVRAVLWLSLLAALALPAGLAPEGAGVPSWLLGAALWAAKAAGLAGIISGISAACATLRLRQAAEWLLAAALLALLAVVALFAGQAGA